MIIMNYMDVETFYKFGLTLFLYLGKKESQFVFLTTNGKFGHYGYFPFGKNEMISHV